MLNLSKHLIGFAILMLFRVSFSYRFGIKQLSVLTIGGKRSLKRTFTEQARLELAWKILIAIGTEVVIVEVATEVVTGILIGGVGFVIIATPIVALKNYTIGVTVVVAGVEKIGSGFFFICVAVIVKRVVGE